MINEKIGAHRKTKELGYYSGWYEEDGKQNHHCKLPGPGSDGFQEYYWIKHLISLHLLMTNWCHPT